MANSFEHPATLKANENRLASSMPQLHFRSGSNQPEQEWDLKRAFAIAQRRALIIASVTGIALGFSLRSALKPKPIIYEGSFQLLVEPVNAENDLTNLTSQAGSRSGRSGLDYDTQIALLKSPDLLSAVVKKVQSSYPGINYVSIVRGLKIRQVRNTKIIAVGYQGEDLGQVQFVLDELSKVYLDYSLNQRQSYLRQGIQFVEQQLSSLQSDVDKLQNKLQKFRRQQGFLDPEAQANKLMTQVNTLEEQQIGVEQELLLTRSQLGGLQEETGMMAALNAAPGYQQILGQMRQIDIEIALERTRFKKENLNIKLLQHKKDNLVPLLEEEARAVLEAQAASATARMATLETQKRALADARTKLNQEIQKLPLLTQVYTNLQRELQITTNSLNRFLGIRQNLQVEAAQKEIPWQLVQEPALAGSSRASDMRKSIIQAVAMSLVAGVGAAMIIEKLDRTFHTAEDLKVKIKQPVLGAIPFDEQLATTINPNLSLRKQRRKKRKSLKQISTKILKSVSKLSRKMNFLDFPDEYESASAFMEAFRVLQANLLLLNRSNNSFNSLLISSALPGDGKSTVALHWAKTAVAMGQRVLLVDADLRRSQVHTQLNLDNSKGLSELVTQRLDPEDAIQQVNPNEELYVLTAGQPPEDPASLLSLWTTKQLMTQLHQEFELVIYDVPPLLGLADAQLLTDYVDGLVLVVGLAKTDRSSLQRAIEVVQECQVPLLGLVANGQRDGNSVVREYV